MEIGHEPRDELIDRVNRGEVTPAEAESEAKRLNFGPLACEPDPDAFDPTREAQWTLPMAVAWIAFRTPGAVRNWWAEYRAECWGWRFVEWRSGPDGPTWKGHFLEQRSKPSLALLTIASASSRADDRCQMEMTAQEAEQALWDALREGLLQASGIDTRSERRVTIPALQWYELKPVGDRDEFDEVRHGVFGTGYRDLLLPSAALRGLWREPRFKPLMALPATMAPTGDGHMPLYCAAQWIATEGGTRDFDPEDLGVWRPAYCALLGAIASEKVPVVGTCDGQREPVPGFHFVACAVDYPFSDAGLDLILGDEVYLRSCPYIDEEHWRGGFDDALINRRTNLWVRLAVLRSAVLDLWPFEYEPPKTGAPGRPSSMHLVELELERRIESGELEGGVREQSRALAEWVAKSYSNRQPPGAKAIENRIRHRFREIRKAQN